ncbi:MAG: hypothetical protein P4M07_08685 [Xanthobacteraceae bacterium]|nr:hypothetical protein [Xanthobacteraceae bacterium]
MTDLHPLAVEDAPVLAAMRQATAPLYIPADDAVPSTPLKGA